MTTPALPVNQGNQQPANLSTLVGRYRQFVLTVGLFAALTVGFYGYVYSQFRQAQFILVPAVITALVAASPVIFWLVRRGQNSLAGFLVLIGLAIAYAGNEAVWEGLTIFHLIGGVLLILLAGSFILPRRVFTWLGVAVLYVGLLWVINALGTSGYTLPFILPVRIVYERFPLMLPFSLGSNMLLGLAFLAQVLVEFQARTLRTRLLVIIIVLTFVPVAAVITSTGILNANNALQESISQMETIGGLKEAEIDAWLGTMSNSLRVILPEGEAPEQFRILLTTPSTEVAWQQSYQALQNELRSTVTYFGLFETYVLTNRDGDIILSTNTSFEGANEAGSPYFEQALSGPVNSPLYVSQTFRKQVLVFARPVTSGGETIGLLAGLVELDRLGEIMNVSMAMGETGEIFLVRYPGVIITPSRFDGYPVGSLVGSEVMSNVLQRGEAGENLRGRGSYIGYRGVPVLGYYRWVPSLQVALFAEQSQNEALGTAINSLQWNLALSMLFVVMAFAAGTIVARRITSPLSTLASTAEKIAEGNLNLSVDDSIVSEQLDEIGGLGRSFNTMTSQLRVLFSDMETRVAERTTDLERRSNQLQIAAEVARDATSIRNLDDLLKRGAFLLRERFGYYHAGIFLVDERGEYAVLVAATGEAGRKMLERRHRLKVGEIGMVGYVTRTGMQRVAMDVHSDPTHYINPDLPETQSEAALPLRVGTTIIGAVDVQSVEKDAFNAETVGVLQIVTDQLAVAISSARLVRELQATLRQLEVVYGDFTRDAWAAASQRLSGVSGYRFDGLSIVPLRVDGDEQAGETVGAQPAKIATAGQAPREFQIPLRLRDQVIGEITMQFEGEAPGPEVVEIYNEIGSRLALLLENARLLQDAQNLAIREQQINQIATEVRSSVNMDAILRNTVREIGMAFGASRTYIQLMPGIDNATSQPGTAVSMKED